MSHNNLEGPFGNAGLCAGDEIGYGAGRLLQVAVAIQVFFLVLSKVTLRPWHFLWAIHVTYIFSICSMMLDWPDDTFAEQLPAPAFTAAVIISLSFLMVRNVDSGRLSTLRMAAVDSPLLYLLKISIFCSKVINSLAIFLPRASLSLRSHFGARCTNDHCTNCAKTLRWTRTREHVHAAGRTARERRLRETHTSCLLHPLPPPKSQSTRLRTLGSVVLVGLTWLCSDFCSWLSQLYVDFHLPSQKSSILYLITCHK